jgi:serine/threonine protein phosphatase PrpC
VSGYRAGDVASETAVSVTLEAFDRQSGRADARLARAAQEANIAIYDRAMVVPELRGMATTLTAIAVERGQLSAVHVGDSRLYLVRAWRALQLTKDHRAGKTTLTRSVGRELICAIDKLTRPLEDGDVLVLCTDGVHNFLPDEDLAPLVEGVEPVRACRAILDAALARGADDNLTIAVVAPRNAPRAKTKEAGLGDRWRRFVARGR